MVRLQRPGKCHSVLTAGILGCQFCGGSKGINSALKDNEEMGSLLFGISPVAVG